MAIGEALIDFIPEESGKAMKDVCGFQPAVGGAPANVCGAYRKLGGPAEMITQLGDFQMKDAHKKAIEYAKEAGAIISFDPNIRLPLWKNAEDLKAAILEFSNRYCAKNVLKAGAIVSYPTMDEM